MSKGQKVNINRSNNDIFYRYKMPTLLAKVEGKGNGIKTLLSNITEVAKALNRPASYPTKYFGLEIGAQTQILTGTDRYVVNGSHSAARLQTLLDGFIQKFVLCPSCSNPETKLGVNKKGEEILQVCIACGHRGFVSMKHKLSTYIVKNPPREQDGGLVYVEEEEVKNKKDKKAEKKAAKVKSAGNGVSPSAKSIKEEDDCDWGEEVSDAAVRARKDQLTGGARNHINDDDVEKSEMQRINILHSFIKNRKEAGQLNGQENEKSIYSEASRLNVKSKATLICVELLFDENILEQVKKFKSLLRRFTNESEKAQMQLLNGLEILVGRIHPGTLMPKFVHILKVFYEEDILEEEVILAWSEASSSSSKMISDKIFKELKAKAAPLIKWLEEAEEEESSEEESESDSDFEVSIGMQNKCIIGKPSVAAVAVEDEADDDLNIEDI